MVEAAVQLKVDVKNSEQWRRPWHKSGARKGGGLEKCKPEKAET